MTTAADHGKMMVWFLNNNKHRKLTKSNHATIHQMIILSGNWALALAGPGDRLKMMLGDG